ncbi:42978_t:CDS:2, partial [Gigaspora margarita]
VSENPDINEFILNDGKLKWIPYERITNIKYLAQAINICNGLRPNLDIVNVPQPLKILIIKCWDDNPQHRPKVQELYLHFDEWYFDQDSEFHQQYHQIKVAKESLKLTAYNDLTYQTHRQVIYTSRLFDLNLISKKLNLEI